MVSVDATEPRLLLDGARDVVAASWSPDGTEILFYGKANRGYELYVMNADGTDVRALTSTRGVSEITPDWYAPPSDVEPVAPDCA